MSIRSLIRAYLKWWYETWYLDMFKPKRIFQSFVIATIGMLITLFILANTINLY